MKLRNLIVFTAILFIASPVWAAAGDAQTLYLDHCARCHGPEGRGDGDDFTQQRPRPTDFTTGMYKFRSTPLKTLPTLADVERLTAEGHLSAPMPPFRGILSDDEIRVVSEYVLGISRKHSELKDGAAEAIERPLALDVRQPTAEELEQGKKVYTKFCMICHAEDGRGLGKQAEKLFDEHGFWVLTSDVTDAMSYGGGSNVSDMFVTYKQGVVPRRMPAYAKILKDEEIAAVAYYVKSLQVDSPDRVLISQDEWKKALPTKVRGEYLYRAMTCSLCHNSYDETGHYYSELHQAGGVAVDLPGLGVYYSSNLTDHPDGLKDWTEEEIVRLMTTGYAKDRRIEAFAMPWTFYSYLEPQDALDIAAYIKTFPPVQNEIPPRHMYPFWQRIWLRIRQMLNIETGRLEYPPFNKGRRDEAPFGTERSDKGYR